MSEINANPKPGRVEDVSLTIRDYLKLVDEGKIVDYQYNRGAQGTRGTQVNEIAEHFSPVGLGIIHVSRRADNKLELTDGHTRTRALLQRHGNSMMSEEEYDFPVIVRVVHESDHFRAYSAVNSGIAHSSTMKITNPDYLLGYWGQRIQKDAGIALSSTALECMWDTVVAKLGRPAEEISVAYSHQTRHFNRLNLYNEPAESKRMIISEDFYHEILRALKYYETFRQEFSKLSPMSSRGAMLPGSKQILRQKGPFALIFHDAMRKNPIITRKKTPAQLAGLAALAPDKFLDFTRPLGQHNLADLGVKAMFGFLKIDVDPVSQREWVYGKDDRDLGRRDRNLQLVGSA